MARAWSFLTIEENRRQFTGNLGYDDVLERYYSFDSTVPNHGAVQAGDLAVIRDSRFVLGFGWIDEVETWLATKPRLRCPSCQKAGFKARRHRSPRFRCGRCDLEFDEPIERETDVTVYRAVYERTWRPLDIEAFQRHLHLDHLVGAPEWRLGRVPVPIRGGHTVKTGPVRVGQQRFRLAMLDRFGHECAVLGPQPGTVLEAAHLYAYATNPVHDVRGGLLLRRELHALFDRGLLIIDPDEWCVRIAPELRRYPDLWSLNGRSLRVPAALRPDPSYLRRHIATVGFRTKSR